MLRVELLPAAIIAVTLFLLVAMWGICHRMRHSRTAGRIYALAFETKRWLRELHNLVLLIYRSRLFWEPGGLGLEVAIWYPPPPSTTI